MKVCAIKGCNIYTPKFLKSSQEKVLKPPLKNTREDRTLIFAESLAVHTEISTVSRGLSTTT